VIAGSGMMHGGRIMHHLVDYLGDARNTLLVIGFLSPGTTGRAITEGAPSVRIDHQDIPVKAHVEVIRSYSAHADKDKLVRWVTSGKHLPKKVFLNHGEHAAAESLAQVLRDSNGIESIVPKYGETYTHP
jgi:metallo-beta-lactamase family protein